MQWIENYKQDGVEALLAHPDLERDITDIRAHMDDFPDAIQCELRSILFDLSKAIEAQIAAMSSTLQDEQEGIARARQNAQACLSYLKSSGAEEL